MSHAEACDHHKGQSRVLSAAALPHVAHAGSELPPQGETLHLSGSAPQHASSHPKLAFAAEGDPGIMFHTCAVNPPKGQSLVPKASALTYVAHACSELPPRGEPLQLRGAVYMTVYSRRQLALGAECDPGIRSHAGAVYYLKRQSRVQKATALSHIIHACSERPQQGMALQPRVSASMRVSGHRQLALGAAGDPGIMSRADAVYHLHWRSRAHWVAA